MLAYAHANHVSEGLEGNLLSEDDPWRTLDRRIETVAQVWG